MSLSQIEISRENLLHNLGAIRTYLQPGVAVAAVVKGNAYGHGQREITSLLEDQVEYFQVDDLAELRLLRETSQKPALVLGYVAVEELAEAVSLNGQLCVYDRLRLPKLEEIGASLGRQVPVQVKVDAWLGRQGILLEELKDYLAFLRSFPHVRVAGLYSHFSNIEDTSDFTHAQKQIDAFAQACRVAQEAGSTDVLTHLSSTSGVLEYEKSSRANRLVRVGIGLYGLYPSQELSEKHGALGLKPVLRWSTRIAQIKTLPLGYPVGYGLSYVTSRETRMAIIPQGYADGYDRGLSNKGQVLIQGERCPVIGRVAMNMFAVDVTHLPQVEQEEEVVLLGEQKNERISAEEMATWLDTVNYEVTTRLSPLLPRIIR